MGIFLVCVIGFCCLIAGPISFALVMRLFDRLERLETANERKTEMLKRLIQTCQALQGRLDEQEKLARLQQLSRQETPDLSAAQSESPVTSITPGTEPVTGMDFVPAETVPVDTSFETAASEAVAKAAPSVPFAIFPETVEPQAVASQTAGPPIAASQITDPSALEEALQTAREHADHREGGFSTPFEPSVTPASAFEQQPEPVAPKTAEPPVKTRSATPHSKPHTPNSPTPWLSLELLIGRKVLPWVASGLFLLFAVFLFQYAFEMGMITEVHKILGMGLLSVIFLGVGKYFAVKRLRYFSTALTSAGISIAFLTGYATYGFYSLLPAKYATGIMTAVVVGSFLLSRYYVSRLLGIVSIIAGLAVPMLLRSEIDYYNEFFSYLILLNVGTVVLINVMKRPPIAVLAFIGTQVEFWLWYRGSYAPEKIGSMLAFQAAFYFVYLVDTSLATLRPKQRAGWDDAMRAILSPALFYGTSWFLLRRVDSEFTDQWLGVITFAFSAWYAVLAVIYARRLSRIWNRKANDELKLYWTGGPAAATIMSLAFLALAIPLHFEASAITIGWVTIGAALWCFGNLLGNRTFVVMSLVFLALGVGRMIGFDILHRDPTLLTPLVNAYALPVFSAGLVLCAAGCIGHHVLNTVKPPIQGGLPTSEWELKSQFNYLLGYFGLLVTVVILSVETFEYCRLRPGDFGIPGTACGAFALTELWALVGFVLLVVALACKAPTIRVASLILFGVAACKLLVADLLGRVQFSIELLPIVNTLTAALAAVSLTLVVLPLILRLFDRAPTREIRLTANLLAWAGAIALFVLASIECYYYFHKYPLHLKNWLAVDDKTFFAHASLSVLWALIAFVTFAVGMITKNKPARIAATVILVLAGVKIIALELFVRPMYVMSFPDVDHLAILLPSPMVLANPYFLTILAPSLVAMIAGVWAVRIRTLASESERMALAATGVCGLLLVIISSSIECWKFYTYYDFQLIVSAFFVPSAVDWFQARAALVVFWSIWAIVLFVIGMVSRSHILRVLAMLLLTVTAIFTATTQLFARPDPYMDWPAILITRLDVYETALANPYFLTIAFAFMTMIVLAVWGTRLQRLASGGERGFLTAIGLAGLALAWGALTVECYSYFRIHVETNAIYIANTSVTVFWTVLAVFLALLAHTARSKVLRYAAVALLVVTLVKTLPYELFHRPDDFATLLNPFMLATALLSVALMALAVFSTRVRPAESPVERQVMFALGLAGLALIWVALSDECFTYFKARFALHSLFTANASLTVFWTLFAVSILLVGQRFGSLGLRVAAIVLLVATFAKAIPFELVRRPGDLEPLLNPYMPVLTLLSLVMIGVGVFALGRSGEKPSALISTERLTGQVLAFAGLAMLFICSSIECHDSVRARIGDENAAWVAQMAISMLWSIFAGVLVFVGIVWRSAALRWVAILLFAVTTFKVVINDMAGFDRMYRIGAFFVLALVMMLAAWAYQRFKPELHDEKRPEK